MCPPGKLEAVKTAPRGIGDGPMKASWFKYRLMSANEENGNYILTAFMGLSVPTGSEAFTENHYIVTPTIAFGKGWGDFDFQSTLGRVASRQWQRAGWLWNADCAQHGVPVPGDEAYLARSRG